MGKEPIKEYLCRHCRMGFIGETCLFGESETRQPVQQVKAWGCKNAELREMDMGIDEAGQHEFCPIVLGGPCPISQREHGKIADPGDLAFGNGNSALGMVKIHLAILQK